MLMIVMSLAISLVPLPGVYSVVQSGSRSIQTSQGSRVQQEKQQKKDKSYPMVLNLPSSVTVEPIAVPTGDHAWAVQIVSRGGYSGSGKGDLTLTSDGNLIWSGPDGSCSRKVPEEILSGLTRIVRSVEAPPSATERSAGMCADCYVTGMIVQYRTDAGQVRSSTAIWDNVSQPKVNPDLIAVYDALMAQRGCKPQ